MTSSNGNIFRVTGHLCGELTGPQWIPRIKGQWRGALMFYLICARINDWVNNCEAGDLRRYRTHYDVIVMICGNDNNQQLSCITWEIVAARQLRFFGYHHWNGEVVRVTTLLFTGNVKGKLQSLQWIPRLSPWRYFYFWDSIEYIHVSHKFTYLYARKHHCDPEKGSALTWGASYGPWINFNFSMDK